MLSVPCIAEGFPIPDVTWFHNGTQLENCTEQLRRIPAVCAEYRKPSATLLIISAKLNDTGQYLCTADNSVGSTAYSVFISVQTPTSMFILLSEIKKHNSSFLSPSLSSLFSVPRSSLLPRVPFSSNGLQWFSHLPRLPGTWRA